MLASKGAKVVLGARREQELKQLVDEIQGDGGQAVYQVMDVTNPSDNADIVELAKETFGGVDVIFLNAGIMPNSPLSALKTDEWNQTVDVNIKGVTKWGRQCLECCGFGFSAVSRASIVR